MNKKRMELARRRFRFYTILGFIALMLTVKTYQGLNVKKQSVEASNNEYESNSRVVTEFERYGNMVEENYNYIFIDNEFYPLNSFDDIPEGKTYMKKKFTGGYTLFFEVGEQVGEVE